MRLEEPKGQIRLSSIVCLSLTSAWPPGALQQRAYLWAQKSWVHVSPLYLLAMRLQGSDEILSTLFSTPQKCWGQAQGSPALWKFVFCHFAFIKDLTMVPVFTNHKNSKEDIAVRKKKWKARVAISCCFAASRSRSSMSGPTKPCPQERHWQLASARQGSALCFISASFQFVLHIPQKDVSWGIRET